jgi:hypothetical protein
MTQEPNHHFRPHRLYCNRHEHRTRYYQWCAVLAIVALAALTTRFDGGLQEEPAETKWFVSAIVISLTMAAFSAIAHAFFKNAFVGTAFEGCLVRCTCELFLEELLPKWCS